MTRSSTLYYFTGKGFAIISFDKKVTCFGLKVKISDVVFAFGQCYTEPHMQLHYHSMHCSGKQRIQHKVYSAVCHLWSFNDLCGVKYHNRYHLNLAMTSALAAIM